MAFLSQNALFFVLRVAGLASAFLALIFVINNFLIFGIDAPGVINTLRLGDIFGVDSPKQGYNISQTARHCSNGGCSGWRCLCRLAWAETR